MTVEMYHPELKATQITTEEAFETVWSVEGRGWVRLADHVSQLTEKVTEAPGEASDSELYAVLLAAGGGFAPMQGESRDGMLAKIAILAQHGPTPAELQATAQQVAGVPLTWDPKDHDVKTVQSYLDHATGDERSRVVALERGSDGKQRAGVLDYTPKEN